MATVAEVMNRDVLTVEPSESIGEAAEKMIDGGVGAVVVMEDMVRIVGIVTERDLLRAVAQRARAAEARVRQWMTDELVTIEPETTIEDAAQDDVRAQLPPPARGRRTAGRSASSACAGSRSGSSSTRRSRSAASPSDRLSRVRLVIRFFPNHGGWLEVVCGPMFSGKSEELIRRLRRAEIAGQRVLIVKPRIDNRYDIGHVVSHAGAKMRAVAVDDPAEIPGLVDGYDVVGVDEVQFFAAADRARPRRPRRARAAGHRVRPRPGLPRPARSARCRSSSAAPSSWTSCRPSATAAAGRRR